MILYALLKAVIFTFFGDTVTPMPNHTNILPLFPVIQQYDWGIRGDSYVKKFAKLGYSNQDTPPKMSAPMAEAWASCHPHGIAKVEIKEKQQGLDELIRSCPKWLMGEQAKELMIIGKILSVGQPLSIQNHPNEKYSKELNKLDPKRFDPNPKPEASIALTTVELLYGFRPIDEILHFIKTIPSFSRIFTLEQKQELDSFVQNNKREDFLKKVSSIVLSSENEVNSTHLNLKTLCTELYTYLKSKTRLTKTEEWIIELERYYPEGDVGCFFFYILNLVTLNPGQCQYIAPGIPHAYLSGEMLEFMQSSDNTLRAGLTPKEKDVNTLLKITDFNSTENGIIKSIKKNDNSKLFMFPKEANFAVSVMDKKGTYNCETSGIEILISPDAHGQFNKEMNFSPATMWLVPAAQKHYTVSLENGTLYRLTTVLTVKDSAPLNTNCPF